MDVITGCLLGGLNQGISVFPRIPFGGNIIGHDISVVPKIENKEQRIALQLYEEATASNNSYLSFLFYRQILETGFTNTEKYVNKVYKKRPSERWSALKVVDTFILPKSRNLGEVLNDEYRQAIAHIRRKPGKKKLSFDTIEERIKIATGRNIVKSIAEYYIKKHLKLENKLYLTLSAN